MNFLRTKIRNSLVFLLGVIALASLCLKPCFAYSHMKSIKRVFVDAESTAVLPEYDSLASPIGAEASVLYQGGEQYFFDFQYSLKAANAYAGFSVKANDWLKKSKPWESINSFTFRLKTDAANVPLKISFQVIGSNDVLVDAYSVYVSDYMQSSAYGQWADVVIPKAAFVGIDADSIDQVAFVCEHDYARLNASNMSGRIYIGSPLFSSVVSDFVYIDAFSDRSGYNSLGGNVVNLNAHQSDFTMDIAHSYKGSLRSSYDLSSDLWSGFSFILGGGNGVNAGWVAEECDFSEFGKITFWARAADDFSNPKSFKLEVASSTEKTSIYCKGLSSSWQKYTIDLNASAVSLDRVKQVSIVYEASIVNSVSGVLKGTVYFDDIKFER